MNLEVRNPYTGESLAQLPWATDGSILQTLERAHQRLVSSKLSSSHERSQILLKAANAVAGSRALFQKLICQEAGKPMTLAALEVDRAIDVLRWAAAEAQRFAGEALRLDAGANGRPGFAMSQYFPRGVVLGITPFNFPLNLVVHKVAPAIAAGCPIVIKPSPYTPLTTLKLAELIEGVSGNSGLIQVILATDEQTARLTQAREIGTVSFTGSARVGWLIRKQAPSKPTLLELGGNAWVAIESDVDSSLIPAIAQKIARAAFGYAGQSCISVQNVAVARKHFPALREALAQETRNFAYGDPADSRVLCGPMIHSTAAERIKNRLALDFPVSNDPRNFSGLLATSENAIGSVSCPGLIPPVLVEMPPLSDGLNPSPLVQEEAFAPIATVAAMDRLEDWIGQVNSSPYGLQVGIFTQNLATIERTYREMEVGGVIVNDVPTTRYDHQPYGGVKDSGQGREGVRYAMEEYCDRKFLALSSRIL